MMRLCDIVLNLIQIVATVTFSHFFSVKRRNGSSFFPFLSWLNGKVTSFLLFENHKPFPFLRSKQIAEGDRL
jgi:hypothetical protein